MNQEDKELLLKDLCARLPYRVKCKVTKRSIDGEMLFIRNGLELTIYNVKALVTNNMYEVKPYLFPFSSMTNEQKSELNKKFNVQFSGNDIHSIHYHFEGCWDTDLELDLQDWLWFINWCYKNHFDVNNLIEKGLAVDATGLSIY